MKTAAITLLAAAALALTWTAGEQHRENCVNSGNYDCTVLPWDNGEPRSEIDWSKVKIPDE